MNIQATKIALVKAILDIENSDMIQKVADFIKNETPDFWNTLSLEQQNEIKEGLKALDEGKRVSYDAFLKKIS